MKDMPSLSCSMRERTESRDSMVPTRAYLPHVPQELQQAHALEPFLRTGSTSLYSSPQPLNKHHLAWTQVQHLRPALPWSCTLLGPTKHQRHSVPHASPVHGGLARR